MNAIRILTWTDPEGVHQVPLALSGLEAAQAVAAELAACVDVESVTLSRERTIEARWLTGR